MRLAAQAVRQCGNVIVLTIRIQQHEFSFPERYSAGHVLTDGEAAGLNQMLAENVRNNVSHWVIKALNYLDVTVLPVQTHSHLQRRIAEYAEAYQFTRRNRARVSTPIEIAADEIARKQAEIQGQSQGHAPDSLEVQSLFLRLRTNVAVLEQARELVMKRAAIAGESIKGLLDDT